MLHFGLEERMSPSASRLERYFLNLFGFFVEPKSRLLCLRLGLRSLGVFGFKSGSLKATFSLLKIIYIKLDFKLLSIRL